MAQPRFCAEISRENDEPLGATASRIDHWLLIEYRGLWSADAVRGSGLSDEVKAHLREQVGARPHSRLLFVRRPDRRRHETLTAFSASSVEADERLWRLEFERYDDLRELDLATAGQSVDHPLLVVCTHGKHDPCCARYGRPLYEALAEQLDEASVWQATHVGGDRFAGNVVALPHGLYYGRVDRESAVGLVDEHLAGRIDLDRYRGRSCYGFAVQAAERNVREATGLRGIGDLALVHVHRDGDRLAVGFRDRGGAVHEREVVADEAELTYLTCSAESVRRPRRYRVTRR